MHVKHSAGGGMLSKDWLRRIMHMFKLLNFQVHCLSNFTMTTHTNLNEYNKVF